MFDFDVKRVDGYRAMENTPHGEIRTPTSNWAGLGLSKTSPLPVDDTKNLQWNRGDNSQSNLGATTSVLYATPVQYRNQIAQTKDIHGLLNSLGLNHYISEYFPYIIGMNDIRQYVDDLIEKSYWLENI